MKVMKFGGSSISTVELMNHVSEIVVEEKGKRILVLSAMGKTTNKLKNIAFLISNRDEAKATAALEELKDEYKKIVLDLYKDSRFVSEGLKVVDKHFAVISDIIPRLLTVEQEKIISAQGELISTTLFHLLCQEKNIRSVLLSAFDFMRIDQYAEPDMKHTEKELGNCIAAHASEELFITQGYVCLNAEGGIDNLGRGGSDYTATIIGACLKAEEVQIWTDVDGIHNNDPGVVDYTMPIREISYEEASQFAFFGAKVLHPFSVIPAQKQRVPIRIRNTFDPSSFGTIINENASKKVDCIVSLKENRVLLNIENNNDYSPTQFIEKIYRSISAFHIEIDMMSIVYQSVSIVVSRDTKIDEFVSQLRAYAKVKIESDYSIVNIMGQFRKHSNNALCHIFRVVRRIPIKMVSQRSETCSYLLLLIESKYKDEILNILNKQVLNNKTYHRYGEPNGAEMIDSD